MCDNVFEYALSTPTQNTKPLKKLFLVLTMVLSFPEEMPKFIEFMSELTQSIIDDPSKLKSKAIEIHTTEFWQEPVNNAQKRIEQ
jgi:hypothetical protein